MTYNTITSDNVTGVDGLLQYIAGEITIFVPLMLFTIFAITLFATFFAEKRFTGRSDFLSSLVMASWFTFIIASILSLVPDLINIFTLSICLAVSVISTLIIFFSQRD